MTELESGRRPAYVACLAVFAALLLGAPVNGRAQAPGSVALECYQGMAAGREDATNACLQAAEAGDAHAMFLLAVREPDIERRVERLRQAVDRGHPRAAATLAQIRRRQGQTELANQLVAIAARNGHGPSRIQIAQALRGEGQSAENGARARQILVAVASEGYPAAQYFAYQMLSRGEGGPADREQAARWLAEAASAGMPQAQFEYGVALLDGNPAQATRWLNKAARAGHVGAMFRLAGAFASRPANRGNAARAAYWANRAVLAGHPNAPQLLARIRTAAASAGDASIGQNVIARVQRALTDLGYDPGPVDGKIGQRTRTAISSFQRSRGLQETGEANDQTLADLLKALDGSQ